jgi:hypothetical protein
MLGLADVALLFAPLRCAHADHWSGSGSAGPLTPRSTSVPPQNEMLGLADVALLFAPLRCAHADHWSGSGSAALLQMKPHNASL